MITNLTAFAFKLLKHRALRLHSPKKLWEGDLQQRSVFKKVELVLDYLKVSMTVFFLIRIGGKVVSNERFMKMKTSRHEQLVLHDPADGFVDSDTPGQLYPGSAITGR